ncbi:MAG: N4-gp56 family major capsid protein [Acidobacteriaceae bacterium]
MSIQVYGDITPRTAAYAVFPLLKRGSEELVLEKFGQTYVVPDNKTKIAKFRRYELLPLATTPLVEGVTPAGTKPTITDYTATLVQYGDFIGFSDVIMDTHEDPLLKEYGALCMQQWNETIETIRYNAIKGGTNVGYANGSARTNVNTPITLAAQRTATRALKRQRGKHITNIVASDGRFRTEPVEASFIGICHSDVENDIRNMQGFIPTKQYGTTSPWPNEIGAVEDVRYIRSTLFTPFADAGAAKGAMVSTTGTDADVYPVIYIAENFYGIVPLKGKAAVTLMVVNPKPIAGDPLAQRGTVGWKTMQTALILNDLWGYRLEVAATN